MSTINLRGGPLMAKEASTIWPHICHIVIGLISRSVMDHYDIGHYDSWSWNLFYYRVKIKIKIYSYKAFRWGTACTSTLTDIFSPHQTWFWLTCWKTTPFITIYKPWCWPFARNEKRFTEKVSSFIPSYYQHLSRYNGRGRKSRRTWVQLNKVVKSINDPPDLLTLCFSPFPQKKILQS